MKKKVKEAAKSSSDILGEEIVCCVRTVEAQIKQPFTWHQNEIGTFCHIQ